MRTSKYIITALLVFFSFSLARTQTLGGATIYNFLDLPNTPQLTALGGVNISNISSDIGLSFNNPALLRETMHTQINASFNSMYSGVRNYSLIAGYQAPKWQTSFALGANYFDYGTIPETDPSGNVLGDFHPADYVVQLSAGRRYEKRWFYGATMKFIHSGYGIYRSSGVALDVGFTYYDSTHLLQVAFVAKNMGVQVKAYEGTEAGDLPFDLQLGITKRLAKAPIQFSLTAYHLQDLNIRYNDTAFNNANGFEQDNSGSGFTVDKLLRHFVFATQLYISDKLEITVGYNYLRRKELNIGDAGNGLTGFSLGVGILLKKLQIRYARSNYQNNTGYNQFGLSMNLNDL